MRSTQFHRSGLGHWLRKSLACLLSLSLFIALLPIHVMAAEESYTGAAGVTFSSEESLVTEEALDSVPRTVSALIALPENCTGSYPIAADLKSGTDVGFKLWIEGGVPRLAWRESGASELVRVQAEDQTVLGKGWTLITFVLGETASDSFCFIDGVAVTLENYSGAYAQPSGNSGRQVKLGASYYETSANFPGEIGYLAFWSDMRTGDEVKKEADALKYDGTVLPSDADTDNDLLGAWNFASGEGRKDCYIYDDASLNGNDILLESASHTEDAAEYMWDNNTCTAKLSCSVCGQLIAKEQVTATLQDGYYCASFSNSSFEAQKKAAVNYAGADGLTFSGLELPLTPATALAAIPRTYSALIKLLEDHTANQAIFADFKDGGSDDFKFYVNGGVPYLAWRNGQSTVKVESVCGSIADDTWHLVTFTVGDDAVSFYLDGEAKATVNKTFSASTGSGRVPRVGADYYTDYANFSGTIGYIAVWSDVRTADEVASEAASLKNEGSNVPADASNFGDDLLGAWNFAPVDENTNRCVYEDASSYQNHIALADAVHCGAPEYSWSGDQCTASLTCDNCGQELKETVSGVLDGGVYTASFTSTLFSDQTKQADGNLTTGTVGDCDWSFDPATKVLTLKPNSDTDGETDSYTYANTNTPFSTIAASVEKIVIEDGVSQLGDHLFAHFAALTDVQFPESGLTTLGEGVFRNCDALVDITLPDTISSLGRALFYDCANLETANLGNGNYNEVPTLVFGACSSLTEVTLSGSVTSLGYDQSASGVNRGVFYNSNSVKEITYGNTQEAWVEVRNGLTEESADVAILASGTLVVHCTDGDYYTENHDSSTFEVPIDYATWHKFNLQFPSYPSDPTHNSGNYLQGLEIYNDIIFVTYDGGWVRMYDFQKAKAGGTETECFLYEFRMTCALNSNHAGGATFGPDKFDTDDPFPLMYVNCDLSTLCCYVERIVWDEDASGYVWNNDNDAYELKAGVGNYSSEMVQLIDFSPLAGWCNHGDKGTGAGNNATSEGVNTHSGSLAMIEHDTKTIVYLGREKLSIGDLSNKFIMANFDLPQCSEGNVAGTVYEDGYTVTGENSETLTVFCPVVRLTNKDILEMPDGVEQTADGYYSWDYWANMYQGSCIFRKNVFLSYGGGSATQWNDKTFRTGIVCYPYNSDVMSRYLDISGSSGCNNWSGEPQGLLVYDGHMYHIMSGNILHELTIDLDDLNSSYTLSCTKDYSAVESAIKTAVEADIDDGFSVESVTLPEDLDLNGTELSFTAEVSIYTTWTVQTYEITIYLSLTDPVTYSVSFDSNGGSTVVSQTVTSGEAAVVPAAPTRSGYSFVGWYSDENLTAAYDFSTAVTSDFMLYAKWKLNSGSANSSSSNTITTVTNNDDGSITTTVTNKTTGVIKETTETENGTSATIVTSKNGKIVSVTATVSPVAAESGEIVALPVEVLAAENTDDAVGIVVSIPDDAASVAVEISVVDVGLGNVAVIVNEDGTETLVQTSVVTENGVALILEGSQTVKIIENSKEFTDTEGHWAESSIDFVSARELFGGYTDGSFGPSNVMSRQLLWTVLARLDGYDTDGDAYGHGRQWAVSNGVSDGSNPTAAVTREQLVTMLWRYDGSVGSDFSLDYFDDRDRVADYADTAMAWAVQHGIVSGTSPTTLSPETTSDRAQLATILCRYVNGYKTIK